MTKLCLSAVLVCLFFAFGVDSVASEIFYQESIDASATYRMTRMTNNDSTIFWEEDLPGNSEFGLLTDFLSYSHSINGVDPPILPSGTLWKVRLKLYLRNHSNDDLVLTVDSLALDKINRRHFLIGPGEDDSLCVQESPLADGYVTIVLERNDDEEQFALYRSVFDVTYTPANPTDVAEADDLIPTGFVLGANYPNPFNPSTTIEYTLPSRSHVRVEVLDVLGRVVRTLVDEIQPAGDHALTWDGKDNSGAVAATGIYLYRVEAGDFTGARKMILLK